MVLRYHLLHSLILYFHYCNMPNRNNHYLFLCFFSACLQEFRSLESDLSQEKQPRRSRHLASNYAYGTEGPSTSIV